MTEQFEPKIVGFLCNWCSYAGADSAGGQHRDVPANLKVVRVMCSGRVDPQFILQAFHEGADGVMVLGCHPGDCHYKEGNYKALRRMKLLERLLTQFGIEKERFRLDWVAASEGEKFSRVTNEMVETVRSLGPLRMKKKIAEQPVERRETMSDKPKIALYWGAACGGCDVAALDINEKILDVGAAADIVLWPIAADGKYKDIEALPDGAIAACLFNGGVRNSETEHIAKLLRQKSKIMVAIGACAMMGGVPGLANQFHREEILDTVYNKAVGIDNPTGKPPQEKTEVKEGTIEIPSFSERVSPLNEVVDVDYYLPGCPPTPEWVWTAIQAIVSGKLPEKGAVIGETKTVCDECKRVRSDKRSIKKMYRPHEIIPDPQKCLLEQGILCMGPATRSGCRTTCINANMPCRGCYGAAPGVQDQGAKMLSAVCSLIDSNDEKEIEQILASVRDPMGLLYQFALPKSILKGNIKQ